MGQSLGIRPYDRGLHDLGNGIYAWLQPDGGWGWSNAGLVVDGDESLLVDTLFDLKLTQEMLDAMHGDRIGLVGFAGRAEIRCPLTFDYGFFEHILDELEIGSVALGGTNISDAIHKGLDCFQDEYPTPTGM